jgi:hypothetical protein
MENKQARLTIFDMKSTNKNQRKRIVKWLLSIAKELEEAKPEEYVKNPRWTLFS